MLFALHDAQAKSLHPDFQLVRGEVQQYGDWLVGCDNNAECTMIGFPETLALRVPDVPEHDMAIQISLKRSADGNPVVELVPYSFDAGLKALDGKAEPFVLNVEYDVAAISPQHGLTRQVLLPMEALAVIRHLSQDKHLEGSHFSSGRAIVRFPESEFKRAFNAMQKRHVQLLKDIVGGNDIPIKSILRRIPAVPLILPGLAPIDAAENCGKSPMQAMQRYGFPDGAELWSYSCDDGSYPPRTYWEMAPEASVRTAHLRLPEPRDQVVRAGIDGLESATFDFDFGVLREYKFYKGREDCGSFRAWGFTESGWQLLERREMPLCMGLDPADWIPTYYAPTEGAGPDE